MSANGNVENVNIPNRLTFKRSEVTRITRLDGKVIDFWQKELGGFAVMTNKMGEQFYSRRDLLLIFKIKQWLIVERTSKAKIRERIKQEARNANEYIPDEDTFEAKSEQKSELKSEFKPENKRKSENRENIDEKKVLPPEALKTIKQSLLDILTILEKNDKT